MTRWVLENQTLKIIEQLGVQVTISDEEIKKIEEFEKTQQNPDLVAYAKMICRNTTGREIAQIQEIYLDKIDKEYLSSK